MRTVKQDDRNNVVASAANPSRSTNLKRRGFLLTLGVGGAGAAAIAVRSLSAGSVNMDAAAPVNDDGNYAATTHVQTYYKTAKI